MTKEQAINYLRSSGFSEKQIQTVCNAIVEHCKDCVSRQAVLEEISENILKYEDGCTAIQIIDDIKELPSVQPIRIKGEWTFDDIDTYYYLETYKCSICAELCVGQGNYCPNCGADMREGE